MAQDSAIMYLSLLIVDAKNAQTKLPLNGFLLWMTCKPWTTCITYLVVVSCTCMVVQRFDFEVTICRVNATMSMSCSMMDCAMC